MKDTAFLLLLSMPWAVGCLNRYPAPASIAADFRVVPGIRTTTTSGAATCPRRRRIRPRSNTIFLHGILL